MTTQVECKLIREGGSYAEVGGIEYHFAPQEDGAHVATIENEDHADVFLGIREGYRLYRGVAKVEAPATVIDKPADPAPQVASEPADDEREELVKKYEELYGEPPHARTGVKKLREMIAAKQTV